MNNVKFRIKVKGRWKLRWELLKLRFTMWRVKKALIKRLQFTKWLEEYVEGLPIAPMGIHNNLQSVIKAIIDKR
jgi:hypothetical protein